ncbi:MAG: hypothetical protein K5924_03590 [Chloroflexi bacterium]|nr:hypothetical protein [Chloroflexota bacterium]
MANRSTYRRPFLLVLLVTVALTLAACARESDENLNEGVNPSPGEVVVEVRLTDDSIEMPAEIPGGGVLFEVTNSGTAPHGFAIEGVDERLDSLFSDDLEELRVTLDPGTYRVYSPVEGDADAGLDLELTVTESEDSAS